MLEAWKVGVYIEDEFMCLATCTLEEYANTAKEQLEECGWHDVEIVRCERFLNVLNVGDESYDLTRY